MEMIDEAFSKVEDGWNLALWMMEDGFSLEQLQELTPTDAESWMRIKPMLPTSQEENVFENEDKSNRYFIVYQCGHSSETRGKTSQERKEPCNEWNILKSRRPPSDSASHQGRCPSCGKRTNLSIKNTHCFNRPEHAYDFISHMSRSFPHD